MLEALSRELRAGSHAALVQAARRAFLLTLGTLALPAALLGALLRLLRPEAVPLDALLVLLLLAAVLSAAAWALARRAAREPDVPAQRAALSAAIQAATVPGVPLLFACALPGGWGWLPLAGLAALAGGLVWTQLPGWVRAPAQNSAAQNPPAAGPAGPSERQG